MTKPLAVVIGAAGKLPLAGLSFYYLQHVFGLQTLGYDVHYLERQNQVNDCYDPRLGAMTDDPSYALDYLGAVLPQFGIQPSRYRFIDRDNRCHGAGWPALCEVLDRCDFVLTVANPTWFDELERCPRRAFIDGDPAFTQVAMETGEGSRAFVAQHYDTLFTYGTRLGKVDCTIPVAGRHWIPLAQSWQPAYGR